MYHVMHEELGCVSCMYSIVDHKVVFLLVLMQAGAFPELYDVINGTNCDGNLLLVETTLQILPEFEFVCMCVSYVCVYHIQNLY